jgi:2-methylcitrate dehydratase PrpD
MNPAPRPSLARGMIRAARSFRPGALEGELRAKVKVALLDMLSCALQALDTPAGRAVVKLATRHQGGRAGVIGTPLTVAPEMAAFVNATLAHGLVREDMHTASVSHLGVVVLPALLALAQQKIVSGAAFLDAAVSGYEAGAAIGRALMDAEMVRVHRPTGITGPLGAALAGSLLFELDDDAAVSALSLAANAAAGLNEWARCGADDMYVQAGFAARNAVTSVELAALGVSASETALDGEAGLFRALGRPGAAESVELFAGPRPEILNVYHKPAPACNYAQTACQAALALREERFEAREIRGIEVRCPAAAIHYPGCNAAGPFHRVLQAKMSIPFCVAAVITRGSLDERTFRQLDHPEIGRLASLTRLVEEPEFTRAYPGAQGAEVVVELNGGRRLSRRLRDLTPASPQLVRERFRAAAAPVLGGVAADVIEATIDSLEGQEDAGVLNALVTAH